MRPPKNIWPNTDAARGILFFAQHMQEMLTSQSFESFRVMSLDTLARIREAILVLEDVSRSRLPRQALEPVISELLWSLGEDPAAKVRQPAIILTLTAQIRSKDSTVSEIGRHLRHILSILSPDYRIFLEKEIISLINQKDKRINLRHTTGFYCSHIINMGHSKNFLLRLLDKIFFQPPTIDDQNNLLLSFFDQINENKKIFDTYFLVDRSFANFLEKIQLTVHRNSRTLPRWVQEKFSKHNLTEDFAVYHKKIEAHDEESAVSAAEASLIQTRALTFLAPYDTPCSWKGEICVAMSEADSGDIVQISGQTFGRFGEKKTLSGKSLKELTSYSTKLFAHFDPSSAERLLSSLSTSALARRSSSVENQLISLWSAIEVLLTEPEHGEARIVHYTKILTPCICLKYTRRQLVAVFDELLVVYGRKFSSIVKEEINIDGTDQHTKFAAILFLKENKELQRKLLDLCTDNPLALHRLWKLQRDFGTSSTLKSTIDAHELRVKWQIHRIYRARNNLVHAGRVPSYLESIILNCLEYYRSTIGTIIGRASSIYFKSDIDQIVSEIGIEYKSYLSEAHEIKKDESFSTETVRRFFR